MKNSWKLKDYLQLSAVVVVFILLWLFEPTRQLAKGLSILVGCFIAIILLIFVGGKLQKDTPQVMNRKASSDEPVKCPICNSRQVTANQRGFSIVTGFWGSGNVVITCLKCGYRWKPGKR